jgi:hypothetical protein
MPASNRLEDDMADYLSSERDFSTLSLTDLLQARELFHFHLIHKKNVVGTAVGRYRIRKSDPWPTKMGDPALDHSPQRKTPRTLANSEVRPYSWPAVLVFVDEWIQEHEFGPRVPSAEMVPPAIFMPNGDKVPICVVKVEKDERAPTLQGNYTFPGSYLGGGYPIIAQVQDQEHVASVGCLVTDGHLVYALTNRHVTGATGETIYSILNGNRVAVGTSSGSQLTRLNFEEVYPGWPGKDVYVHLDIGLIEVDDVNRWTTQVYGVGEIGNVADLSTRNLTLRLIGCPVMAYGAASGLMQGEIGALFYRYKAVGGSEYVADFLIGPRRGQSLGTRPGDSGTLWMMEPSDAREKPMPIALQWGGQVFLEGRDSVASSYALATCLSTVCDQLDLDVIRDWNLGLPEYWGAVGHYSIANKATKVIRDPDLQNLMEANLANITYDVSQITKKNMQGLSKREFVPLADVPDMVWKVGPHKRGGMTSPEHSNHFADMDRVLNPPLPQGATLLDICKKPANVAVLVWQRYYDAVQKQFPGEHESRGLLPFRVWQIYQTMVKAAGQGDVDTFVCAAGIVSHYVGDACQPLHISYMFNGDPDHTVPGKVRDPKTKETKTEPVPRGTGVHSAYEDDMVDYHVPEIMSGVDGILAGGNPLPLVAGGHGAAVAVAQLMARTFAAVQPAEIVDAFVAVQQEKPKERALALWTSKLDRPGGTKTLGEETIKIMADGCCALAQIWDSAWAEGKGSSNITKLGEIQQDVLEKLYQNPGFLPSHTLDTIGPLLNGQDGSASGNNGGGSNGNRRKIKRSRSRRSRARG